MNIITDFSEEVQFNISQLPKPIQLKLFDCVERFYYGDSVSYMFDFYGWSEEEKKMISLHIPPSFIRYGSERVVSTDNAYDAGLFLYVIGTLLKIEYDKSI